MEILAVLAIGALVAVVGFRLGMLAAVRLGRRAEPEDEDDDGTD